MTLKTKKTLFNISTAISVISVIFIIIALINFKDIRRAEIINLLIIICIVLLASIFIQILFRKTLSTEVVFFSVFLASLSLQSLRLLPCIINIDSYLLFTLSTRTALFLKYLAVFCLLGSSLFSYTIKKQKIGSWTLLCILISATISSVMNLNSIFSYQTLTAPIIFHGQELIVTLTAGILILFSFIKTSVDSKNREYLFLGIGSFLLPIAFQLTFISLKTGSSVVVMILLLLGSFLYIRSLHKISLWS